MGWASLMFEWINMHTSLLTLVVQVFTVAVLAWTLFWVRRYTVAAEKQVAASLEQVEALQKPFLTVTWEPLITDPETSVEIYMASGENRPLRLGQVPSDGFEIYNVGSGPALNVSYQIRSAQNGKILRPLCASSFPHFSPPENSLPTDITRSVLNGSVNRDALGESENLEFVIEYKSLRGVSYQTVISIHREGLTEDPLGQPCSDFTWVITGVHPVCLRSAARYGRGRGLPGIRDAS